jgi:hypothetical protein
MAIRALGAVLMMSMLDAARRLARRLRRGEYTGTRAALRGKFLCKNRQL